MKINVKSLELIESGLSSKTVSKLTESQINILHSKLLSEQPQPQVVNKTVKQIVLPSGSQTTVGGVSVSNAGGKTIVTPTTEEMKEDEEDSMDFEKGARSQDPHQVGPSSDDGFGNYGDGTGEFNEAKKSNKNPWAICTASLSDEFGTSERSEWSKSQMAKYERCVKDVKKSLKEGKNSVSLFLESQIMKIVERNLPPKITKSDLMKYISEQSPATAPSKPKTKPTTKPGTKPTTRPSHPGKNPNPGENPSPKAVSPERAKDEVLDVIMDILRKK